MSVKKHKAQTFEIEIDDNYTAADRETIAEDMIDEIVDNTIGGKDRHGKPMVALSKDYKTFKKKVTGYSKADLKFSGEMLGSLRFIKSKSGKGKITVGFKGGTTQNAKAKGHITGDVGKVRDFLGLPDSDIQKVLAQYPVDDKEAKKKAIEAALALREFLRGKKDE